MASRSASPAPLKILDEVGLGELPADWTIVRIEALLSDDRGISVGVMYPGDHYPAGIPLIKAGDLVGSRINPRPEFRITPEKHHEYRRTRLEGGELLVSLVGDVGRCAIVPHDMAGWNAARAIAVLRFVDPSDAAFVRACLMSAPLQHLMQAWATTTVQATLNLKEIRQLPLPWPPKEQRIAIAHILGTLDRKIELNRRKNETLEAIARALFKSWFVDFDPVRAKADGRDPGLPQPLADLFPDSFEESALGEIPKAWTVGTVSTLADRIIEKVDDPADWAEEHLIDLSRMPQRSIALSDWGAGAELSTSVTRFQTRDTLFGAIRPYFHKVGLAPVAGVTNISVFVVRPKKPADWPFVAIFCSMGDTVDYATRVSKGTKMPVVSWTDFAESSLVVPNDDVRSRFNQTVGPLCDRIVAHVVESRTLAATRDSLLPKLISGELRIEGPTDFPDRSPQ